MQTFLPYDDFEKSARCLDRQRLGKQRVECLQLLRALENPSYGWQNHPALKMWRGYCGYLALYGAVVCEVWMERGYKDTCRDKILSYLPTMDTLMSYVEPPPWLGNEEFHRSHQSNLIRKKPEHYRPIFGADIPDNLPYIWP